MSEPRVRLRDVTLDDADLLDAWSADPAPFNDFGGGRAPVDREALAAGPMRNEQNGVLIVELIEGSRPLGTVSWHQVGYGPPGGSDAWNIGIELAPDARGHGYGGEAQALVARYLFEHTSVNRVEAADRHRQRRRATGAREGRLRPRGRGAWLPVPGRRVSRPRRLLDPPRRGRVRLTGSLPTDARARPRDVPPRPTGSSGRRCCRSVGASELSRSMARLAAATIRARSARARRCDRGDIRGARSMSVSSSAISRRASLSDSIQGGAAPAFRSIRWAIAHSPAAASSSIGSRLALVREAVERALLHRLADLPLDEALPRVRGLQPTLGVPTLRTHGPIVARRRDRRGVTVRCYGSGTWIASTGSPSTQPPTSSPTSPAST